jgi:hypothetical protein
LASWTSSFQVGSVKDFNSWIWRRLEWHKIQSVHEHGTIDHMGSIHFSYVWLCNWEYHFLAWPEGESPRALHVGQALPWKVVPTQCNTMQFLCAPAVQFIDQPYTTFNSTVGSKIHHQKPQPVGSSHIGWSELLPTSYKARETSLVFFNTIGKPKGAWPTFVSFPWTHTFQGDGPGMVYCHVSATWDELSPKKEKGLWVPN